MTCRGPSPLTSLTLPAGSDKPIAVSESGDTSRDVELKAFNLTLQGSEAGQQQFTQLLLQTAARRPLCVRDPLRHHRLREAVCRNSRAGR